MQYNILFVKVNIVLAKLSFFVLLYLMLDWDLLKCLPIILPLVLCVAFLTLFERKVLAGLQRRRGPNVVGLYGTLQAFADAVKLLGKESIIPSSANNGLFLLAPLFIFVCSLLSGSVVPIDYMVVIADIDVGLLFVFAISSFGVYGIILSGGASNSKYAFLGSLRSAAQLISYEVSMALVTMPIIMAAGSTNLTAIVLAQKTIFFGWSLFPSFILFFISALAETNRVPFDLPEAESELVSGYNVEYSAVGFVLFFLAEYANIILMSSLIVILFMGGWLPGITAVNGPGYLGFAVKQTLIVFIFIWIRGTLPRYRYDQLMSLGGKTILPVSLGLFVLSVALFLFFGGFDGLRLENLCTY